MSRRARRPRKADREPTSPTSQTAAKVAGVLPWLFTVGCAGFFVYDNVRVFPFMHNDLFQRGPFYGSSRNEGMWREVSKIFNICVGEAEGRMVEGGQNLCIARGRPLSFLVDLLDAKTLVAINRHVHFAPRNISHYVIAALTVWFLYKTFCLFFPRDSSWGRGMGAAMASLYMIVPETVTMNGFYFRSAKELAGLFIVMMFYVFCRWCHGELTDKQKIVWSLVLCLGALSDETAVAVAGLMAVVVAIDGRASPRERFRMMLLYGAPVGCYLVCQRWLDGFLALKLEGIPTTRAFASPSDFISFQLPLIGNALTMLAFRLQLHLGNPQMQPWIVSAIIVVCVGLACNLARRSPTAGETTRQILSWQQTVVLAAGIGGVYCLMAMRHPAILGEAVRSLGYYYIALFLVALFAFTQLPLLRRACHSERGRGMLLAGMAAMALGHAYTAPQMRSSYLLNGDSQQLYIAQRNSQLLARWWDGQDPARAGRYSGNLVAYRDWLVRTVNRAQ